MTTISEIMTINSSATESNFNDSDDVTTMGISPTDDGTFPTTTDDGGVYPHDLFDLEARKNGQLIL